MTTLLTQEQVRLLARSVGFSKKNARTVSAIAMCESPFVSHGETFSDFGAIGDIDLANDTWGYSYGGLQIRSLRVQKGTGQYRDEDRLPDPEFNLRSARTIRGNAGGFGPWSTFTSGQYKAYLQDEFPPPEGSYVVLAGDSLSRIASKVSGGKWTWQDLASMNGLHPPYMLHIGEMLLLPTKTVGA